MSDIDTAVVDSLKALDPKRPIREADIGQHFMLQWRSCLHMRRPLRAKLVAAHAYPFRAIANWLDVDWLFVEDSREAPYSHLI